MKKRLVFTAAFVIAAALAAGCQNGQTSANGASETGAPQTAEGTQAQDAGEDAGAELLRTVKTTQYFTMSRWRRRILKKFWRRGECAQCDEYPAMAFYRHNGRGSFRAAGGGYGGRNEKCGRSAGRHAWRRYRKARWSGEARRSRKVRRPGSAQGAWEACAGGSREAGAAGRRREAGAAGRRRETGAAPGRGETGAAEGAEPPELPQGAEVPEGADIPEAATPSGPEKPSEGGSAKAGIADAPLAIVVSCQAGSELDAGLACQNMAAEAQLLGYGTKILTSPTMVLNGQGAGDLQGAFGYSG